MPSNVKKGTILSGPGKPVSPGSRSALCKGFHDAVEAWCDPKREKGTGKTFNDHYFEQLAKQGKEGKELATMQREVPILVNGNSVQTLEAAAEGGGKAGKAALALFNETLGFEAEALAGGLSWNGMRWQCLLQSWRTPGLKGRLRFPDGMLDGTPVEIKGPGDTARQNQFEDYNKVSKTKKVIEISCRSCGNDCEDGNKCPKTT